MLRRHDTQSFHLLQALLSHLGRPTDGAIADGFAHHLVSCKAGSLAVDACRHRLTCTPATASFVVSSSLHKKEDLASHQKQ